MLLNIIIIIHSFQNVTESPPPHQYRGSISRYSRKVVYQNQNTVYMGILRTVNNIINLPEIYYYILCVGVVKLQSGNPNMHLWIARMILIAKSLQRYITWTHLICYAQVVSHPPPLPYSILMLPWWSRSFSSEDVCWVQPAISIRGLNGSRTNKQYSGQGWALRGMGGDQPAICHLVLVAMETNDYPWQHDRAHGM